MSMQNKLHQVKDFSKRKKTTKLSGPNAARK